MAQYCVHYLFLAFIWHLAVFPQLSFSAGVDKQSTFRFSQQAVRRCLRSCHPVTRIPIKAKIPNQQPCLEECLQRNDKLDSPGILHQIKPLMKRIKRDASVNSTESPKLYDGQYGCLGCKNCSNVTEALFPTGPKVTFHIFNNTDRYYANISWNPLQSNKVQWTGYHLTYYFTEFSAENEHCEPKLAKNVTHYVVDNSSYGIIHGTRFLAWISSHPFVPNSENTENLNENFLGKSSGTCQVPWTCTLPEHSKHPSTTGYSTHLPTSGSRPANHVVPIIVILVFLLLTGVAAYIYRKRKERKPFVLYKESTAEFDAFIIYSSFDEQFVNEILLPTLETKYGLTCCIHYRDFKPGVPFRDNMVESVYKSRKTVAVMSHNFFSSQYCRGELDIALHCSLKRKDDSVVVIKVDDVDRNKLPKALKCRSYIDYTKSKEKEMWEDKMIKCLKT